MSQPSEINIQVDGTSYTIATGTVLAALLTELGHTAADKVATAVNGAFVPRNLRNDYVLREDDVVLLFRPIMGG